MVEESECSGVLKTCKLLIFRHAKNAEHGEIAPNWNVSGTRTFQSAGQFCKEHLSGNCVILPSGFGSLPPNFPESRLWATTVTFGRRDARSTKGARIDAAHARCLLRMLSSRAFPASPIESAMIMQ